MNEEFSSIEINIFTSIFSDVNSIENPKSIYGVAALDALISVKISDKEEEGDQISNNLSNGLRSNKADDKFLNTVSHSLGCMAMVATSVKRKFSTEFYFWEAYIFSFSGILSSNIPFFVIPYFSSKACG